MELEAEAEKLRKENQELLKKQVSNNVVNICIYIYICCYQEHIYICFPNTFSRQLFNDRQAETMLELQTKLVIYNTLSFFGFAFLCVFVYVIYQTISVL